MQEAQDKKRLATLTLAALGIVYGDIGTSPLYAIKEVFGSTHHPVPITPENVLGILSLFFWSLIIVVTLKYVSFIMRANNKGCFTGTASSRRPSRSFRRSKVWKSSPPPSSLTSCRSP